VAPGMHTRPTASPNSTGLWYLLAPLELALWALGTVVVLELAEALVCRLSPVTCSPILPSWMVWMAFGVVGVSVAACAYRCWRVLHPSE